MFRNVKELTTEELQKELQAIELFEQEIGKVRRTVICSADGCN